MRPTSAESVVRARSSSRNCGGEGHELPSRSPEDRGRLSGLSGGQARRRDGGGGAGWEYAVIKHLPESSPAPPSKFSITSLFQNRITRNPSDSMKRVRSSSWRARSPCCPPIEFHDQHGLPAHRIANERADRHLPAELEAAAARRLLRWRQRHLSASVASLRSSCALLVGLSRNLVIPPPPTASRERRGASLHEQADNFAFTISLALLMSSSPAWRSFSSGHHLAHVLDRRGAESRP